MNKVMSNKKYILIFMLPAFLVYVTFALAPMFYNLYLSFFRTDLMSPKSFIAFKNYTNLMKDQFFRMSLRNNMLLVVGSLIAHLPLALLFGNAIFNKVKGSKFYQTTYFLPTVICGVAVGMMFNFVYHSEFGLVNAFLDFLNLGDWKRQWLSEKETVMICLVVVVMWRFVGYHMVIQLAAMRAIPQSLYESTEIDGANGFQKFWYITFPLIKHIIRIDAILIITGSLKYFDLIFAMTNGGPSHAGEVLATYMYTQGFRSLKFGYASAIGVILLALCVIAVVLSNTIFKSEEVEY